MTDSKKNTSSKLGKRMARYASVSTSMAGLGMRATAGRMGFGASSPKDNVGKQAIAMRMALGGLKGPLMKIAQMMATIPDLIPPEYAKELLQLQADAPPMGEAFVKRRMVTELGTNWEKKFKSFTTAAAAAASLGQVHKAVTKGNKTVACKLQYPDMDSIVDADLGQLKFILKLFEVYDRAVSTNQVQQEIADRLHEELDYKREAKHIALYNIMHAKTSGVHVPISVPELSTKRLLTMSWLDGDRFVTTEKRSLKDRNQIAINLFQAWYIPFYSYGVIHGDPHMGNYTVRRDNSINLLDFGCIRIFTPELVQGVILLYRSLLENKQDMAIEAYKVFGFKNITKDLVEVLNIWARFIYAPLLEDKKRLIEETNTGFYGRQTASKVHEELRKLGRLEVPREFVFMDRAAVGLGSVFLRLQAEVNWYRMFRELIDDFDIKSMAKKQSGALKACGLQAPARRLG